MKRKPEDEAMAYMRALDRSVHNAFNGTADDEMPSTGNAVADSLALYNAARIRKELREKSGGDGPTAPIRYLGVWKADGGYGIGAIVTHDGVLWHCDAPTSSRPPGPEWTLMHKSISRR